MAGGATARGVDWNSETAQELRFSQLIKVIDPERPFSLLDYGCGYGALAAYLLRLGYPLEYYAGYDILESILIKAREGVANQPGWLFMLWLVLAGLERFLVEFLRAKDDRFIGALTLAQVISLSIVAVGVAGMMRTRNAAPEPAAA